MTGLVCLGAGGLGGLGVAAYRASRPVAGAQTASASATLFPIPAALPSDAGPEDPLRRDSIGRKGPWGQIRSVRIGIEPAKALFAGMPPIPTETRWFFGKLDLAGVRATLTRVGLTPAQRQVLENSAREETPQGTWLKPPNDLVLGLSPEVRTRLYQQLAPFDENDQRSPIAVRSSLVDERIDRSFLPPPVRRTFRKLLYGEGRWLFFADRPALASLLHTPEDQGHLAEMLAQNTTFLLTVIVDDDADVDAIANYWGYEGRAKNLEPLLSALRRVPGRHELDVTHLLPPFARRRIFTFVDPTSDDRSRGRDCYWTALNFFEDPAGDRIFDNAGFMEALASGYHKVAAPGFGDIVLFTDKDGAPVHASSYLADEFVFTKNGGALMYPWMFMKLDSLFALYSAFWPPESPLAISYYRRNE